MPAARTSPSRSEEGSDKRFRGWPVEAVEFLEEIEAENTKAFWLAHKKVYEEKVLAPMNALLAELAAEFGEGRVFRPYRDTRFSADKSPYKTNIAAHNDAGYISMSSEALGVGSGLYMPSSDQLARFRAAVAHDRTGAELVRLVGALRQKRIVLSAREVLRSAPRGYPSDHPRIELLRHKGLTAWKQWPVGAWLGTASAKRRVAEFLRSTAPLRKWLTSNVGAAEAP
ncbi:MAG: DUF2461 domain-containing protein [Acidimicrobiales bacterium]